MKNVNILSYTLRFIGFVQIVLGLIFLFAPDQFAEAQGFELLPTWGIWLFGQMAARFIGYGIGMFVAANDLKRNKLWIDTMLLIQAIDWLVTIRFMIAGATIAQVTTAPIFPLFFIAIILYYRSEYKQ